MTEKICECAVGLRFARAFHFRLEKKLSAQAQTHRLDEIVSRNTSQNVCNDFEELRAVVECIQTNNYIRIALIFFVRSLRCVVCLVQIVFFV